LQTDINFNRIPIDSFWEGDAEVLDSFKKDLIIEPVEIVVYPGESKILEEIKINDETIFWVSRQIFTNQISGDGENRLMCL